MNLKSVILIIFLSFLTSCGSSLEKRLDVNIVENSRPSFILPQPQKTVLDDVEYFVITPENADQIFKLMKEKNLDPIIIGTSIDGFSLIVSNNVKVKEIIETYQNYIIQQNKYYSSSKN